MTPRILLLVFLAALALVAGAAFADPETQPASLEGIEQYLLPKVDAWAAREADERRAARGLSSHYAVAHEVAITPWSHGSWELAPRQQARWRLRLTSPGALSLNLAFGRFVMPEGGRLRLESADGRLSIGPFTAGDVDEHGELWTPPLPAADLVLDLSLPIDRLEELELELARVHHGYAGFGEAGPLAGECQLDVVCSEGEPWDDQARSVALISVAGVRFCTGFLVNNTALDGRPLFITADHCGISPRNAASVVVMWKHQRAVCDQTGPGREDFEYWRHFQTGATFRASYRPTDTVLLELDDSPDPAAGVYYAGWDRTSQDPERPVAIHHPNTDFKRISFAFDNAVSSRHLGAAAEPAGNHLRVARWDLGTTEGGSSGAPLFNRDRRVVGQLHGGYAACGNQRADWFGRLSVAWVGRGSPATRLSDWLDPIGSGATTLDGLETSSLP